MLRDSLLFIRQTSDAAMYTHDVEQIVALSRCLTCVRVCVSAMQEQECASRVLQCLSRLVESNIASIAAEIDVFIALLTEALSSASALLQLSSLNSLNQVIVPLHKRFETEFIDRVRQLTESSSSLIQNAAFQFLALYTAFVSPVCVSLTRPSPVS